MDLARLVNEASVPELILLRSLIDRRVQRRKTATCTCCGVEKSVDAFSPRATRKGHQSQCRECRNRYRRRVYRVERGKPPVQLTLLKFELEGG